MLLRRNCLTSFCLFLYFLVTHAVLAYCQVEPDHVVVYGPGDRLALREIDLRNVRPGEKGETSVLLRNETETPFKVSEVGLSCTCMRAKVRDEELKPGAETLMVFEFKAEAKPTNRTRTVNATLDIDSETGRRLVLQFKFWYRNLLVLPPTFVHESIVDDKLVATSETFSIPIIVSPDVNMQQVEVIESADLDWIDIQVAKGKSGWELNGSYRTEYVTSGKQSGSVTLRCGNAETSTIVEIVGKSRYSLFPSTVKLFREGGRPTRFGNASHSGTAFGREGQTVFDVCHELRKIRWLVR